MVCNGSAEGRSRRIHLCTLLCSQRLIVPVLAECKEGEKLSVADRLVDLPTKCIAISQPGMKRGLDVRTGRKQLTQLGLLLGSQLPEKNDMFDVVLHFVARTSRLSQSRGGIA